MQMVFGLKVNVIYLIKIQKEFLLKGDCLVALGFSFLYGYSIIVICSVK